MSPAQQQAILDMKECDDICVSVLYFQKEIYEYTKLSDESDMFDFRRWNKKKYEEIVNYYNN